MSASAARLSTACSTFWEPREESLGRCCANLPTVSASAGRDVLDERSLFDGVAECLRERRRQVLGRDPNVGVADMAGRNELGDRVLCRVDGDGEADAAVVAV